MTGRVDLCFAFLVGCTRTDTVQDRPGGRAGSCCFSGFTETPFGAFTRTEPRPMPALPVLVIVNFTVLHLPTLSFSAFGLAIERIGAPGRVDGTGGPAAGDGEDAVDPCEPDADGSAGGGGDGTAIGKKFHCSVVPGDATAIAAQLYPWPTAFEEVYASVVVLSLTDLLGYPSGSEGSSGELLEVRGTERIPVVSRQHEEGSDKVAMFQ